MANWIVKIDVADIWDKFQDDEDFEEFKEALIPILSEKVDEIRNKIGEVEAMQFEDKISEIEYNANDVEEFDYIWQDMYDWADDNMVWIGTF
jgi:hypothetical protein